MTCRLCGATDVAVFTAREHLLGTGEPFDYVECAACGGIHIAAVPANLARYYGGAYDTARRSRLKQVMRTAGYRLAFRDGFPGRLVGLALPSANVGLLTALRELDVPPTASFLDVGSGAGRLLEGLRALGFSGRLVGVDPFLPENHTSSTGVELRAGVLDDVDETFDVVTMIHTLEHIPEQRETMHAMRRALTSSGVGLVSIPVSGGTAWDAYRSDWVQLDPPRHIVLHTTKSLELIAEDAGLRVRRTIWDSTSFQFWGSERVAARKPILPLWRSWLRSAWRVPLDSARAARANAAGRGDQATFVLAPSSGP